MTKEIILLKAMIIPRIIIFIGLMIAFSLFGFIAVGVEWFDLKFWMENRYGMISSEYSLVIAVLCHIYALFKIFEILICKGELIKLNNDILIIKKFRSYNLREIDFENIEISERRRYRLIIPLFDGRRIDIGIALSYRSDDFINDLKKALRDRLAEKA
jgi:hypothetical protein